MTNTETKKRSLWKKALSCFVIFLVGRFDQIVGYLSGSVAEDVGKAVKNSQTWWDSNMPLITWNGLELTFTAIGGCGMLILGFLWIAQIPLVRRLFRKAEAAQLEPEPTQQDKSTPQGVPHSVDDVELLKVCKKELVDIAEDFGFISEMHSGQRRRLQDSIRRAEDSVELIAGHHNRNELSRCYAKYGDIGRESVVLTQLKECADSCVTFVRDLARKLQRRMLDEAVKARAAEVGIGSVFPLPIKDDEPNVGPSFGFRPICGESLVRLSGSDVIAKLAIKNGSGKLLKRCSVKLVDAFLLMRGHVMSSSGFSPSVSSSRGESFHLRWSDNEPATPDRRFLDMPAGEDEHIADVLIVDQENPGVALFCSAETVQGPDRISSRPDSVWWKLRIRVSSESGASELVELVSACSDRDPGPITLSHWNSKGEEILRIQQEQIANQQANREKGGDHPPASKSD